ncbi:MAG: sulfotransferase domain-containing protein [Actinomycetota bacterium]|nr:sulfotransferase domain-containing protein [Actinomycetota bacterium]
MRCIGAVPNFIYIGTSKAGSTWIFSVLDYHPSVFVFPQKGLHFFSAHYDRGVDWYLEHFANAGERKIVAEISHSLLFSSDAPGRIAELNPGMKLMACLREPVDRAFSEYLDLVKNGRFQGTFEDALDQAPQIVEHGRYGTYLPGYLDQFPRDQLLVTVFDDLKADPRAFAESMFRFLEIESIVLPPSVLRERMPAGVPRSPAIAKLAKKGSRLALRLGFVRLYGKVKASTKIRNVLYRPYGRSDRPPLSPETAARLRARYAPEVAAVDALLGTNLVDRWGYGDETADELLRPSHVPSTEPSV